MKKLPRFPKPYKKASFDYDGGNDTTAVALAMAQLWLVMLESAGCDKLESPKFTAMEVSMFRELYDEYGEGLFNYWVTSSIEVKLKQRCNEEEARRVFRNLLTGKEQG